VVLGAGNGGLAMAGYLALRGHHVRILNKSEPRIESVAARGYVELRGRIEGRGAVEFATTDPGRAVAGADVIMVVIPASAHRDAAHMLAPHLTDGQIVVLNPGRTGGALEVASAIRALGCRADVTVAEAQTFAFASRTVEPGVAFVHGVKKVVFLAALPAARTPHVLEALGGALPQFAAAANVLETSIDNIGAVFHPGPTILNAGRIESAHGFDYYREGITPSVAAVLEAVDEERLRVGRALGVEGTPVLRWLEEAYGAAGHSIYEAVQNTSDYEGLHAPENLCTRYIFEDVPTGLVPLSSLGKVLGVPTPTMDALVELGSRLHRTDYRAAGRTAERLGVAGLSASEIRTRVDEGEW